ncbi:Murein DD-endopeptidase MepM and murein hydrolase activator NlpD, contain LysM domain [Bosea sp. CRIB-10]|uniref:M23 family metallopeptidase n=1 Tax=Bosea sp. CRIB-10 TaxID=378404 RepID=UPI0008E87EF3|nr:M23 family metallopeptidase [Bosea sp. CRIB-10]SFB66611.1 Murein DD-endopeptidase MepM and murein hydrolase activator NlpD, contain LysM domain [Bosea sp. CRIB-10]
MTSSNSRVQATGNELAVTGLLSRRSFTISRSTALLGLSLLALTTAWSGATSWYILRKDDLAARLISRETSRQYAYEDRIAALRADVDRLASRALLDQDGVEARVGEIAMRQAELESRQSLVNAVAESLQSAGIGVSQAAKNPLRQRMIKPEEPVRASGVTSFAPFASGKPTPAPETLPLRGAGERSAPWQSGEIEEPVPPAKRVAEALIQLDQSIERSSATQLAALREIDKTLGDTQKTLRSALAETRLDTDKLAVATPVPKGVGGPLVPVNLDASAGPFEATLSSLQPRIATVFRLRSLVEQLPIRRPLAGELELSSNYGYRADPFTRGAALHTGMDLRAEHGAPIRATGPGKVVTAEYSGGYGNMVEIEHAGGITTRYAHMSAILVSEGQTVAAGALVGRVGSTGRSTGPHLHYETRIDGDPADPNRFLRAGDKLAGQL